MKMAFSEVGVIVVHDDISSLTFTVTSFQEGTVKSVAT